MFRELEYSQGVTLLLSSFQSLEFALKIYIATTYKIIVRKLDGAIPFNYSYQTIKDFPLERLLNCFAKMNANTDLQSRLNKLRKHRNHVAHQALLPRHEVIRDILDEDFQQTKDQLAAVLTELDDCSAELVRELERVFKIHADLSAA